MENKKWRTIAKTVLGWTLPPIYVGAYSAALVNLAKDAAAGKLEMALAFLAATGLIITITHLTKTRWLARDESAKLRTALAEKASEVERLEGELSAKVAEVERLDSLVTMYRFEDKMVRASLAHMVMDVHELEARHPRSLGFMGALGDRLSRNHIRATSEGFEGEAYISTSTITKGFVQVLGGLTSRFTAVVESLKRKEDDQVKEQDKVRILTKAFGELADMILKVTDKAHEAPSNPTLAEIRERTTNALLKICDDIVRCGVLDQEQVESMVEGLAAPPFHRIVTRRVEWMLSPDRPHDWGRRVFLKVCRQNGRTIPEELEQPSSS